MTYFPGAPLYCGRAGSDVIGCHRPTGGVFVCMLQTRVTLTAFLIATPIATPRGRSSKFPRRGTNYGYIIMLNWVQSGSNLVILLVWFGFCLFVYMTGFLLVCAFCLLWCFVVFVCFLFVLLCAFYLGVLLWCFVVFACLICFIESEIKLCAFCLGVL